MVGHRPSPLPRAALAIILALALAASVASLADPLGQVSAADYPSPWLRRELTSQCCRTAAWTSITVSTLPTSAI